VWSFLRAYNCNLILYPLHSGLPVRHEAQAGSCEALIVPISTIRASLFTVLSLELSSRQNTATLAHAVGGSKTLVGYLQEHLSHLQAGDYFCILAHIEMNATHHMLLQTIR
jgi:hypothetical protein